MQLSEGKLNNILTDDQAKVFLIDKPKGVNSFKAVSVLRKVLGIKKVGFAGTLDPLASGLLILATSSATKLLDLFHTLPKEYEAEITFGQTSDTYDLEGEIVVNNKAKEFDEKYLDKVLKKFVGQYKQQAPLYSAKKVRGQKLHKLARQGKSVTPPSKEITVYSLDVKSFSYPKLVLNVKCSAGTYIRSLAYDLGQITEQGALLSNLRRTAIGKFKVKDALDLNEVNKNTLSKQGISTKDIITHLDQFHGQ